MFTSRQSSGDANGRSTPAFAASLSVIPARRRASATTSATCVSITDRGAAIIHLPSAKKPIAKLSTSAGPRASHLHIQSNLSNGPAALSPPPPPSAIKFRQAAPPPPPPLTPSRPHLHHVPPARCR